MVSRAPVPVNVRENCQESEFTVTAGDRLAFVLSHWSKLEALPEPMGARKHLFERRLYLD